MEKETDNGLEVYLIRHGKTRKARGDELVSAVRDFPLDERGIEQSEALRDRLNNEGHSFNRVYSSPLRVSKETADYVFGEGNYDTDKRLTKHFHGDWENERKDEVYTEEVKRDLESDPYNWH